MPLSSGSRRALHRPAQSPPSLTVPLSRCHREGGADIPGRPAAWEVHIICSYATPARRNTPGWRTLRPTTITTYSDSASRRKRATRFRTGRKFTPSRHQVCVSRKEHVRVTT